jgi:hypothetical protein
MTEMRLEPFRLDQAEEWDSFLDKEAVNGTFLHSRRFLSYHPKERFEDASLMLRKGTDTLVAVLPACRKRGEEGMTFLSHGGSTFGGFVFGKSFYNIEHVREAVALLDSYLWDRGYAKAIMKSTPDLFTGIRPDLQEYCLYAAGYACWEELNPYIDLSACPEDVLSGFCLDRRQGYRHGERKGLAFRKLEDEELESLYALLVENLKKHDLSPVHSLAELQDFRAYRLRDETGAYGVFLEEEMIASGFVFRFGAHAFHTQYLSQDQSKLKLYPMNYLVGNLIKTAREEGFRHFTFGISTEDHGLYLNEGLARFKEGFGAACAVNRTYYKRFLSEKGVRES